MLCKNTIFAYIDHKRRYPQAYDKSAEIHTRSRMICFRCFSGQNILEANLRGPKARAGNFWCEQFDNVRSTSKWNQGWSWSCRQQYLETFHPYGSHTEASRWSMMHPRSCSIQGGLHHTHTHSSLLLIALSRAGHIDLQPSHKCRHCWLNVSLSLALVD